jgi:hypothetical protein
MMERAVYSVLERSGVWNIRLNDKVYGPCRSQEHALDVALSAARKAHGRGAHAHVMVREETGYRSVWCDGHEFSPEGLVRGRSGYSPAFGL